MGWTVSSPLSFSGLQQVLGGSVQSPPQWVPRASFRVSWASPLGSSALHLPEKLNLSFLLADVYISLYIFLHFYICLCVFAYFLCVFLYIYIYIFFFIFSYKTDSLINGGRRRRPPPISLSILYEKIKNIYTKTHKKYANTHKHM